MYRARRLRVSGGTAGRPFVGPVSGDSVGLVASVPLRLPPAHRLDEADEAAPAVAAQLPCDLAGRASVHLLGFVWVIASGSKGVLAGHAGRWATR
jgi:hypothetical protein